MKICTKPKLVSMLIALILFHSRLLDQNAAEDKLLGCWKVKSVEFPKSTENSDEAANSANSMISCFAKNGQFTSKFIENRNEIIVGIGKLVAPPPSYTTHQHWDAADLHIDAPGQIL